MNDEITRILESWVGLEKRKPRATRPVSEKRRVKAEARMRKAFNDAMDRACPASERRVR